MRRIGFATSVLATLFFLGCATGEAPEGPIGTGSAAVTEAPAPKEAKDEKRGRHHGHRKDHAGRHGKWKMGHKGPFAMFGKALKKLDLSAEQKTKIEALKTSMKPSEADLAAHRDFGKALADGVRAGKIDDALMKTKIEALTAKTSAKHGQFGKMIAELHAILAPAQRQQVVAELRRRADKPGQGGPWMHGLEGRDGDDDDEADGAGEPKPRGPKAMRRMGGRGMFKMLRHLDLSDEQRTKLRQARQAERPDPQQMKAHFEEMKAKMKVMLDAFESEKFDAAALVPQHAGKGEWLAKRFERQVAHVKLLLPILDEKQRTKLCDLLERGPDKHHRGGKMRGKEESPE